MGCIPSVSSTWYCSACVRECLSQAGLVSQPRNDDESCGEHRQNRRSFCRANQLLYLHFIPLLMVNAPNESSVCTDVHETSPRVNLAKPMDIGSRTDSLLKKLQHLEREITNLERELSAFSCDDSISRQEGSNLSTHSSLEFKQTFLSCMETELDSLERKMKVIISSEVDC
ncbi:unnamed protein product [Dicrocoelium dendriticum]|nr:unnamed protein product [Dicrocoelium dendriticum]CAH8468935.1 unnamed protein product [Dicrocoelium dendriticum]